MTPFVAFEFDIHDMAKLRKRHEPEIVEKAFSRALDRAQTRAATHISKAVRDDYAVKAKDIKKQLTIKRARRDPTRALVYVGRRLPLERFAPRTKEVRTTATSSRGKTFQTRRRGITVRVRKDTGRQLVAGGWFAKDHVLRRADKDNNRSDPRIQFGPSIPGMVAYPKVIDGAQDLVRYELPREFDRQMRLLLEEAGD